MTRLSPHDLYAQRPVRSDYTRRAGPETSTGGLNIRKIVFLTVVVAALGGAAYGISAYYGQETDAPQEVPTIQADLPLKERPQEPGGIDIPHQDVAVFQQLEQNGQPAPANGGERLLPSPEDPFAGGAEPPSSTETATQPTPTEPAQAVAAPDAPVVTAEESMPPAITDASKEVAAPEPQKTAPVKEVKKEAAKPAAEKKATAKVDTVESKKAEEALSRLPKELFTAENVPAAVATTAVKPAASAESKTTPASGNVQVQLASLGDKASAEKEVAKLQKKYAGILSGVSLTVKSADLGAKGIYYRVVSTPVSSAKAKAICQDIQQQKGNCLLLR